ncbi:hypothetical protein SARC_08344 [Sphaeroforma arctica JP610]|uniref:Uncharacterized protein n=1 Tax=Sphaeroforma arctica JP610 TaxID=667725 RepID=A0A0L0FRD5_9EUKA|nr:hypothetical protein SARC_08344 [Sphaeroforma arctica JP610]KNC79249.1 hypothetical protein SARC_08344 [Sphaeroforma arctica JP610]|eukprot:XP_014153151.1 hypothetical protein SARC_08344 [Sphaeroforma arctica JP610]
MVDIRPPAPMQHPVMLVPKGPANASPIGLMAFGMTTMMLNFYNAGITESGIIGLIACFGIFHGGRAQLLADFSPARSSPGPLSLHTAHSGWDSVCFTGS